MKYLSGLLAAFALALTTAGCKSIYLEEPTPPGDPLPPLSEPASPQTGPAATPGTSASDVWWQPL